jgi:hypothetical protein
MTLLAPSGASLMLVSKRKMKLPPPLSGGGISGLVPSTAPSSVAWQRRQTSLGDSSSSSPGAPDGDTATISPSLLSCMT